jgi:hypothetical protein
MLERMRLIDVAHQWSQSNLGQYDSKINFHSRFLQLFGLPESSPTLIAPPRSQYIVLMWSLLHYSLRPGKTGTLAFTTVRQIRSAKSAQETWLQLLTEMDTTFQSQTNQPLSHLTGRLTDTFGMTLFAKGLENRLGNEETPSVALTSSQVRFLDRQFTLSHRALAGDEKRQTALAALANIFAWTGWMRASELFVLHWDDITLIRPTDGQYHGLPPGAGAFILRLSARTKSSTSHRADIVIATTTASGLCPLAWYDRVLAQMPPGTELTSTYIFTTTERAVWTSAHYRRNFLYPFLHLLMLRGDPLLHQFSGNLPALEQAYWSMHSYRRGGRSEVSKKRPHTLRAATTQEITEHGRWSAKRKNEDMPTRYLEWKLPDRLLITLECM